MALCPTGEPGSKCSLGDHINKTRLPCQYRQIIIMQQYIIRMLSGSLSLSRVKSDNTAVLPSITQLCGFRSQSVACPITGGHSGCQPRACFLASSPHQIFTKLLLTFDTSCMGSTCRCCLRALELITNAGEFMCKRQGVGL